MKEKPKVRVVAGLVIRGDRVLIQQRLADKARPSLWEFPGGKVEAGESDREALEREFMEELGVEAVVGDLVWRTLHEYPDIQVDLTLLKAELSESARPFPKAAQRLAWVKRSEILGYPFCEADLPFLPKLASGRFG